MSGRPQAGRSEMIIWKGWGFLAIPIAVGLAFLGGYLGYLVGAPFGVDTEKFSTRFGMAVGCTVAAVVNWFFGRWLNHSRREAQAGVLNRHSLFWIAMEYWSVPMLIAAMPLFGYAFQK